MTVDNLGPVQNNIVVASDGRASLCDFGMTTLIHSVNSVNPSTEFALASREQSGKYEDAVSFSDCTSTATRHPSSHIRLQGVLHTFLLVLATSGWHVA